MTRFRKILRILAAHGVDFIVVGGISAVLNGATITNLDLDIVHSRELAKIARLFKALEELSAEYRFTGGRKLKRADSHLVSKGHQLLTTRFGPLDVLGTIGNDLGYEDLLAHATEMFVTEDRKAWILRLDKLIEIKESLGTEKDRAVLPTLRRTLEERR